MSPRFPSFDQFISNTIERLKQEMPTTINTRRWARVPDSKNAIVPYVAPHRARVYVEPATPIAEPAREQCPVAVDNAEETITPG